MIINQSMHPLEWAMLLGLSILWGGSFFFVEIVVDSLPPLTIVMLRVALAAMVLNLVVIALGQRLSWRREVWMAFFGMGLLNNMIPFSLIVWGQSYIASGLASILNATTPIFTVVVAHYLTADEKLTSGRIAGVLFGLIGVVVMIGPEVLSGLGSNTMAQIAVLGAAFSYALAGVFGRRFRKLGVTPMVSATGQVTASSLVLIPLALAFDQPWRLPMPGFEIWAAILALALLSTALAYILYFRLLESAGATNLLLVTFLIPISAILLGTSILGEQLELKHYLGMGLIGLGLAAIDGRSLAVLSRRNATNST